MQDNSIPPFRLIEKVEPKDQSCRSGEKCSAQPKKTSSNESARTGYSRTYELRINPGFTSSVFLISVCAEHFFNRRFSEAD